MGVADLRILRKIALLLVLACGSLSSSVGTVENPIKADMPTGERAYFSRLRCSDGAPVKARRLAAGPIGSDGHISDLIEVSCTDSAARILYIDMYHPGYVEERAPVGFTIAPP